MHSLARAACSNGKDMYCSVFAREHREVNVAACKRNHAIFPTKPQPYTRASGHAFSPGLLIPSWAADSLKLNDVRIVCKIVRRCSRHLQQCRY
jgi:hypothetical protein